MLNFDSFRLAAAVIVCSFAAAFASLKYNYPLGDVAQTAGSAAGFVGVNALKALAAALPVWWLSRKAVSLACALNIALFTHLVGQIIADAYFVLTSS